MKRRGSGAYEACRMCGAGEKRGACGECGGYRNCGGPGAGGGPVALQKHRRVSLPLLSPSRILLPLLLILLLLGGCGSGGAAAGGTIGSSGETGGGSGSAASPPPAAEMPAETASGDPASSEASALTVHCFSAGKADAFLLYTQDSAVLIDCGEKGFGKEILAYLEEAGIGRLDCLIVTHFDKDHVGGAAKVLNSFPVDTVLQSNCPKDSEEYEKYCKALSNASLTPVTVRETLRFTLDGVIYSVDPPRKDDYSRDDSNNSSLIVSVWQGDTGLLFTGDAQDERLQEFLSSNRSEYTLLKVPYHGRWQETLPELIRAVRPACAVITSSDSLPEDPKTLALLSDAGVETYLTRQGAVTLYCDGTGIRIETAANLSAAA